MGINVAQVAAILNVILIAVQYTFPLLIALIAVAIIGNRNNAATWSVFGTMINSTKWPSILRTDSASKRRVSKRIIYLSMVAGLTSVLLTLASAIAPLGLHNDTYATDPSSQPFSYVRDTSAIGQATPRRDGYVANRLCGYAAPVNCPGSDGGYTTFSNATGFYAYSDNPSAYISSTISPNITDTFRSATNADDSTIASVLDIQYRAFFNYGNKTVSKDAVWYDQGRPRTQGAMRFFDSFVLNDKIQAVEGLIVDTMNGGIGFRNHTLPPQSQYGTTWTEDILWLEPETTCVDFNVSLDYSLNDAGSGSASARLTDRGGMVNLISTYPEFDLSQSQTNPLLWQRAWKGAELTIWNMLKFLKLKDAPRKLGTTYPVDQTFSTYDPSQVSVAQYDDSSTGPTLPYPLTLYDSKAANSSFSLNSTSAYLEIGVPTQGYGGADLIDINTPAIITGVLLGAGIQIDSSGNPSPPSSAPPILVPATQWRQSLYSCASSLKASIKTVTFHIEGDSTIPNLQILSVVDKTYASPSSHPIWAVERPGMNIADLNPFWGLISASHRANPALQSVQKPTFYLPASQAAISGGINWGGSTSDGSAGLTIPAANLAQIFSSRLGTDTPGIPNYSGADSAPLFQKWQHLSRSADTAGKMINLIWTDLTANTLVSAKSPLSRSSPLPPATSAKQTAVVYENGVSYNPLYGIPAFLLAFLYLVLLFTAIIMVFARHISLELLRHMLNQTSAGRAITHERYGERDENAGPTRYWADTVGSEHVKVTRLVPRSSFGLQQQQQQQGGGAAPQYGSGHAQEYYQSFHPQGASQGQQPQGWYGGQQQHGYAGQQPPIEMVTHIPKM